MKAVQKHHDLVDSKTKNTVLMTVLHGSQNYRVDHENSDIDTCSFTLPTLENMARLKDPDSYEFSTDDGKCVVRDIRLGLNLLKKTSPNSVEWFASKYVVFNPEYLETLSSFMAGDMIHANYSHMLAACAGLAKQLGKRNMPVGKRLSHVIRVRDMWETFLAEDMHILDYRTEENRKTALELKQKDISNELEVLACEETIQRISDEMERIKQSFDQDKYQEREKLSNRLIDTLQKTLFEYYVHLCISRTYKPPKLYIA